MEDLIPFAQFQKRKEHPWSSVTFNTKSATSPCVFFKFFLNEAQVLLNRVKYHLIPEGYCHRYHSRN